MKRVIILVLGAYCLGRLATDGHAAITDGLMGHWPFDETSGATARDTSGKGNNGTVGNNLGDDPQWAAGQIGGALTFRGPDTGGDYVLVPDYTKPGDHFSVSAWVWADPRDNTWPESGIVQSGGVTTRGPIGLVIRLKNRDQAFGPLGNTSADSVGTAAVNETVGFPTGNWQHVGVVADGSQLRLYRNGAEVATAAYSPPLGQPITPELGIGVTPDDGGFPWSGFWQGKIDDVGLWNTALSAAQMASIFNAGQAGKDLTQADAYQNAPPTITSQPASVTRFVGETATFTVQATGTDLSYQWKLNGSPIAAATSATYNIASVTEADAGQYVVVVTNASGSKESDPATLTVRTVGIATGLIGYWKFDETQGDTAADASDGNHPGTFLNYLGDESQWVDGQIDGALQFGGAELRQFVLVPDYAKPSSTLTVSLWVWMDQGSGWSSFVKNWGSTDAGQFHFGLFSDGLHENIYIKQADGKTPNASDPEPFPLQSWQHAAFVCDGSHVRLYRNGAEVASTPYDGTLVLPPMSCIGIEVKVANDCVDADGGAPGWFQGKMDDVAIWNRGLNPNEILAIYQAGQEGKGALEADASQTTAPSITSQPTGADVFEGTVVQLTVAAIGTAPLTYQWFKDGQPIADATSSTLDLGYATSATAGKYKVTISNQAGQATSDEVTVAVQPRPPATLFCEWKFEDNLTDTSGNGNDGSAVGTVAYVTGISGKAVHLEAANPVVNDAANNVPALGTDAWSLNLWLKLAAEPASLAYLAGFGPVTDGGAGTPRSLLAFSGPRNNNIYAWGSNRDTPGSAPYPVDRWAMVTITHDGTDGTTTLFLDGQPIGQNQQPRVDLPAGENRISLAPTSNWNVDVAGDFDEFTLWKGVLNTSQLAALYAVGNPSVALSVSRSGSEVTLSWPATAVGFTLESAASLPATTWTPVSGVQNNSVTVNASTGTQFYRLRK